MGKYSGVDNVSGGGWASREAAFDVDGADPVTGTAATKSADFHECLINCTNGNEIYSFHAAGAHFALADGSARLIRATVSPNAMVALVTSAQGDIIDWSNY